MKKPIPQFPHGGTHPPVDLQTWLTYKHKYGSRYGNVGGGNPLDKRMDWVKWSQQALPTGGKQTPSQLVKQYASQLGLNPGDVMASLFEEGMPLRWKEGDEGLSDSYFDANQNGELNGFAVDGFRAYGLDQMGGRVDEFIQKGYLPKEFKNKMKGYYASNEVDEKEWAKANYQALLNQGYLPKDFQLDLNKNFGKTMNALYDAADVYNKKTGKNLYSSMKKSAHTAAFADDEAAFQAKTAFMAAERDNFSNYTKKLGVKLTPEEERFFTMAAYNGGSGAAQSILNDYKKKNMLGQNQFMKNRSAVWSSVWDHVIPRMAGSDMFSSEKMYRKGGAVLPKANTGMETQPSWAGYVNAAQGFIKKSIQDQQPQQPVSPSFAQQVMNTAQQGQENMMNALANPMSAINLMKGVGAVTDYFTNRKQSREMADWERTQGMADNLYPVTAGSRGDYAVTGSAYGMFRPDQMGAKSGTGMYAEGGPFVPEVSQGLLTNEGPIEPLLSEDLLPAFAGTFATMPAPAPQPESEPVAPKTSNKTSGTASASLRDVIIAKESGGNYKALPRKKDGTLASSAAGAYQFLWNQHKTEIGRITGVTTKQGFLNNPEAQDTYFDYWDQTVLTPWAQKIKKELGVKAPVDQIKFKIHFAGPKGAYDYFKSGKETVDAFGTKTSTYKNGGTYELTAEQIQQILRDGGEVEFI